MKRIVLTGGGTAGHVTPNLALLPLLKAHGYEVRYIGTKNGMEKQLVGRRRDSLRWNLIRQASPLLRLEETLQTRSAS